MLSLASDNFIATAILSPPSYRLSSVKKGACWAHLVLMMAVEYAHMCSAQIRVVTLWRREAGQSEHEKGAQLLSSGCSCQSTPKELAEDHDSLHEQEPIEKGQGGPGIRGQQRREAGQMPSAQCCLKSLNRGRARSHPSMSQLKRWCFTSMSCTPSFSGFFSFSCRKKAQGCSHWAFQELRLFGAQDQNSHLRGKDSTPKETSCPFKIPSVTLAVVN